MSGVCSGDLASKRSCAASDDVDGWMSMDVAAVTMAPRDKLGGGGGEGGALKLVVFNA